MQGRAVIDDDSDKFQHVDGDQHAILVVVLPQ